MRYQSQLNSSRQSTMQGKKREMKFSPKLSIYATNNGLGDKMSSKFSSHRQDKTEAAPFFHMRLKS